MLATALRGIFDAGFKGSLPRELYNPGRRDYDTYSRIQTFIIRNLTIDN